MKKKNLLFGALAAVGAVGAAAYYVHRTFVAITVDGGSMLPTLKSGDRVLIRRGRTGLKRGQIVVIKEPGIASLTNRPRWDAVKGEVVLEGAVAAMETAAPSVEDDAEAATTPKTPGWHGNTPATRDLDASGWYIKRVVALPGDRMPDRVKGFGDRVPAGHIIVIGDHPLSGDSKQHGPCPIHQVLGVVVRRMESRPEPHPQPGPA